MHPTWLNCTIATSRVLQLFKVQHLQFSEWSLICKMKAGMTQRSCECTSVICDFSNFLGRLLFLFHAPLTRYKHIYKCKLGDPELWRAPAPYQSKQTPRAYSDPPQVCQPATVWLISAAADAAGCCTVPQLGSSWGFQDGNVMMEMLLEPRILVV